MNTYKAVMIAEGSDEPEDFDQFIQAWQHLIDTDIVWHLQGSFQRHAQHLINEGFCSPKS